MPQRVFVDKLESKYRIIPICPEQLAGLPIPRPPSRIRRGRVYTGGVDTTEKFVLGAHKTLHKARLHNVEKAYLLKNSPSCDRDHGITGKLLTKSGIRVIKV